jgi:hypothetical protein
VAGGGDVGEVGLADLGGGQDAVVVEPVGDEQVPGGQM